mmetsp:Transcript_33842/g.97297  ORF Transcript_33842/g.97297 Transcript_33842/m.97297 type:complete len:234 (-) Transcript_33842:172-873(-)
MDQTAKTQLSALAAGPSNLQACLRRSSAATASEELDDVAEDGRLTELVCGMESTEMRRPAACGEEDAPQPRPWGEQPRRVELEALRWRHREEVEELLCLDGRRRLARCADSLDEVAEAEPELAMARQRNSARAQPVQPALACAHEGEEERAAGLLAATTIALHHRRKLRLCQSRHPWIAELHESLPHRGECGAVRGRRGILQPRPDLLHLVISPIGHCRRLVRPGLNTAAPRA